MVREYPRAGPVDPASLFQPRCRGTRHLNRLVGQQVALGSRADDVGGIGLLDLGQHLQVARDGVGLDGDAPVAPTGACSA